MPLSRTFMLRSLTLALLVAATVGCSLHRAGKAFHEGRYDEAVQAYREILQKDPDNVKARIGYRRAADHAADLHLERAREAQRRGQDEQVYLEVRKAVVLAPANAVAADWLARLEESIAQKRAQAEAQESLEAQRVKGEDRPAILLNPRSLEGTDLNFIRRVSLREVFSILSKASGVSIILHTSFQDMQISADLRGLSFQRILDTLMLQNDLLYRVVDTNTIMVFKNTPQNRENLENQLIKTFFLSNAEPDTVRTLLQNLMPGLKVFPYKNLNAITVKAKPSELTIAKRIVSQLDKSKAEVMVYLELLEVTENSLEQVGLLPVLGPSDGIGGGAGIYRIGATVDNTGGPNVNKGGIRISRDDIRFLFPSLALDALKSSGDAKLVANPHIRVLSGEPGEVNIGEKISTTQSSIGFGGGTPGAGAGAAGGNMAGGYFPSAQTSYAYEDVGVKIKVEPRVHFNGDVSLKLESEVKTLKSGSTAGRPDLGQRIIKTTARLKNGETAVFGGLLKEEEQKSLQGVWGLSDIPVIGKLIGSNRKQRAKTDVILTIRAVLVRQADLGQEDFEAFDPDLAASKSGIFTPKTETPVKADPAGAVHEDSVPAVSEGKPELGPAAPKDAPTTPATRTTTKSELPLQTAVTRDPEEGALVLFLAPVSAPIAKGERLQLSLLVSNGKGLDTGYVDLRVDPKLKLIGITPGDFLTTDGGNLDQTLNPDGTVRLAFRRASSASDSGALAMIEVEGLQPGNAPLLIQGGRYQAGSNPIGARVVNALVTVE